MARLAAVVLFSPVPKLLVDRPIAFPNPIADSRQGESWQSSHANLAAIQDYPESRSLASRATFCLVFDGRLDNRDELLRSLGTNEKAPLSDSEIVLACFDRWGTETFARLIGDFAFALWDESRKRLYIARDAIGARPIFYHHNRQRLICASSIRQLFGDPQTPQKLSSETIAGHICGDPPRPELTFFDGVMRLPAGHWLEANCDGAIHVHKFWNAEEFQPIQGKPANWHIDDFRERFFQSVLARLRTSRSRIGVQISGGFDSAAVGATVHHWIGESQLSLQPCAFVSEATHPLADERRYVEAILERFPMPIERTASVDHWAFRPAPPVHELQDEPYETAYMTLLMTELERARQLDIDVILTGTGGDEVGGSSWYLVDLLARGYFRRAIAELPLRARGKGQSSLTLIRLVLQAFRQWLRRTPLRPVRPPDWIGPKSAAWRRLPLRTYGGRGPARDELFNRLRFSWTEPTMLAAQPLCRQYGIEMRHPFLDRRIVEWALTLPTFHFGEEGRVKAPMRRAFAGVLPETILRRGDKGIYLHYWELGVRYKERKRISQMLDRPLSAEMGYIDAVRLRRAYENYCQGRLINYKHMWNAITFEAWLRRRAGETSI